MSAPTTPLAGPPGEQSRSSRNLPQDIFKGATIDDLRRHIWVLTTALQGRELEDPTNYLHWPLPCNTIRSADLRQKSDLLCHVSTLLTLGAPRDQDAASVNAVAGLVEHDRISILVASTTDDAREDGPNVQQPRMSQISRISVGDAHQAMSLLRDFKADIENIEFNKHLEDVATIVSFFHQMAQSTDTHADNLALFSVFIIRRAFRKLSARLHNMTTIWGASDPVAVMLEEFKAAPVIKDHIVTFERPLHSKHSTVIALRKRLEVEGVSSSGGCIVTSDNVCAWLRALSTILTNLKNTLPEASKAPPSPKGACYICGELVLLDAFLRSSFFEALGNSGVERQLWRAYKTGQDTQRQKWRDMQGVAADHKEFALARTEDADAHGDREDESSKINPGEDALKHVKRYLHTITAWFVACRALSASHKAQGVPLHFYHLKAGPGNAIPPDVTQQFKDMYLRFFLSTQAGDDHYRSACTLLDNAFPPGSSKCCPRSVAVHAEAAIMALASNSIAGNDGSGHIPEMQDASTVFSTGDVPIGISKKCCACCDLFAKYLHESSPSLTFHLPGTHGIIYPWMLPPYTVPPAVLKGMCNKLFTTFLRVTSTAEPGLLSTQSSPASTASDLEQLDVLSGFARMMAQFG